LRADDTHKVHAHERRKIIGPSFERLNFAGGEGEAGVDAETHDLRPRGLLQAYVVAIGVETAKKPHGLKKFKAVRFRKESSLQPFQSKIF
jgi:hypothetical protein